MHVRRSTTTSAGGLRIAVVVSRYHDQVTSVLRDGAVGLFSEAGGRSDDLTVCTVPGTWELVALARELADRDSIDAIVALGCVIAGETRHDEYIASAVANGLMGVTVQTGKPVGFGVLTCQSAEMALSRAGGAQGNKGVEAMIAAIESASLLRQLRQVEEVC